MQTYIVTAKGRHAEMEFTCRADSKVAACDFVRHLFERGGQCWWMDFEAREWPSPAQREAERMAVAMDSLTHEQRLAIQEKVNALGGMTTPEMLAGLYKGERP
jgi:hypothetical protein